jgi:dihydrofolate synthase/folylpolyglutamate synthase
MSKRFTTYEQAERYLFSSTNYETERRVDYHKGTFNLQRMEKLLAGLGKPHEKIRTVHVAGTKGKGSTAAMLTAMLAANGLRVGLYTSPHLVDLTERIQIAGRNIPKTEFTELMNTVFPVVEKMRKSQAPTFFEILTALAFLHFARREVDIAVVEVGMGGRLDSTNVLTPEVCCITSISFDHMKQLGNTLPKIASEKAGIIKAGVPVITAPQQPDAAAVIEETAAARGAPLYTLGRNVEYHFRNERLRHEPVSNRVTVKFPHGQFRHIPVPLMGEHQGLNCGVALTAAALLKQKGWPLDFEKCITGLERTDWPGRMERLAADPPFLLDGAHNAASMQALMKGIGQNITYDSMIVIFGCQRDKDIDGMLDQLKLGADKVVFTRTNNPRAADPFELAARMSEKYGKESQVAPDLDSAIRFARAAASREDLITVTGSLYLVGEARRMLSAQRVTAAAAAAPRSGSGALRLTAAARG